MRTGARGRDQKHVPARLSPRLRSQVGIRFFLVHTMGARLLEKKTRMVSGDVHKASIHSIMSAYRPDHDIA